MRNIETPTLGIDGNQWYLLSGGDLMTGRSVFASTLGELKDAWHNTYGTWADLPSPYNHLEFETMTVKQYKEQSR